MNRVEVWTSFVHCQMRNARYSDVTTEIQNHEDLTGFGLFFVGKIAECLADKS